jgi:hypothetical protein
MAVLNIRNLPDDVHSRLRIRAAENHRSMEAEARAILTEAVAEPEEPLDEGPEYLPDYIAWLYGGNVPTGVVDELIAERRREAEKE